MNKPFVSLYIYTSLDGYITGNWGSAPETAESSEVFNKLGFEEKDGLKLHFQGWLYGSKTSLSYFTSEVGNLEKSKVRVPEGDFIPEQNVDRYYIALDRNGKLGWKENTTDYNGHAANVMELLTELATDDYKNYLRSKQIPYIICGKEKIDLKLALDKLYTKFGMKNIMLGGGGMLNWSMVSSGLCDEIRLIVAPAIDGSKGATPLFNSNFGNNNQPVGLKLESSKVMGKNTLYLRYLVDKD